MHTTYSLPDITWLRSFWHRVRAVWRRQPRLVLLANGAVLFGLLFVVSWLKLDPDFGWHLQVGNYIRAHGIPAHDIFTYTAPHFPWIDHEWGNDVLVSLLYGWGGYGLLTALYAALWTVGLLLAGRRAQLWVLLLATLAVVPYAGIRPVAWTVCFLAVTVRLLYSPRRRLVWLLPLLFVVWANLHAGFIIGLAIIAYWGLYYRRPALFGVVALSAAATCLNAYGPRLYVEVARTLFDPTLHQQVGEWAPLSFWAPVELFMVVWGAGGFLTESRTIRAWLRPSVPMLLSVFSANRNVPLFVVVALAECDGYVRAIRQQFQRQAGRLARRVAIVAALLAILAGGYWLRASFWPLNANRAASYPAAAVAYLRQNGCRDGRLFNDYNYGGYLIWQLPTTPLYIDGRMPSWKDESGQKYMTRYYRLLDYPHDYYAEFARYDVHCVLLRKDSRNAALIRLLERDGWQPAVQDSHSALLLSPNGS